MARPRDPRRDQARELWEQSKGALPLKDIASKLGVSDGQVRKWKCDDKWEGRSNSNSNVTKQAKSNVTKPKVTKKPRLRLLDNNVTNLGGAPENNQNALKHGLYAKIYNITPEEKEYLEWLARQSADERFDLIYSIAALKFKRMTGKDKESHIPDVQGVELEALNLMRRATVDKHKVAYDNARLALEEKKVTKELEEDEDININIEVGYADPQRNVE